MGKALFDKEEKKIHQAKPIPLPTKEAWQPPIPFTERALPSFPASSLPSTLQAFTLAVSEALQVPVDMVAVAVLAVCAVGVQRKFVIEGMPGWTEPLNLFAVVVAAPGERKSATMAIATKPVYQHEQRENERLFPEVEQYETKRNILSRTVKDLEEKAAKGKASIMDAVEKRQELNDLTEVKFVRMLADDCTPEVLTSLMAEHDGRMAVVSAEGGIFETLNGRYSNGVNIDTFLKAHAGDPIRVDRKGRPAEYIPHPALTVLLAIQPVVLDGLMANEAFKGRGLNARFLYTIPVSRVGARRVGTAPVPPHIEAEYAEVVQSLCDIPMPDEEQTIHLSPEAQEISTAFAIGLEPRLIDDLEAIGEWANKLHGAILRIAGILHCVNHGKQAAVVPVPVETMQGAIEIGLYLIEHAKAAYLLMGADKQTQDARYILRQLEKGQYAEIPRRDLFRICRGRFKKAEDILPVIGMLEECGYLRIRQAERKGPGRKPDAIIEINPLTYGQNGHNGLNSEFRPISPFSPQGTETKTAYDEGGVTL